MISPCAGTECTRYSYSKNAILHIAGILLQVYQMTKGFVAGRSLAYTRHEMGNNVVCMNLILQTVVITNYCG